MYITNSLAGAAHLQNSRISNATWAGYGCIAPVVRHFITGLWFVASEPLV